MASDDALWAEVRREYETGKENLRAIALRFGITEGQMYRRARSEGWTPRRRFAVRAEPRPKPRSAHSTRASREALIRRLYRAIDAKLARVETRIMARGEKSPEDEERDMRALESMIKGFEKVTGVEIGLDKAGRADPARTPAALPDAERMRNEIADRLEKLARDRASGPGPDGSE